MFMFIPHCIHDFVLRLVVLVRFAGMWWYSEVNFNYEECTLGLTYQKDSADDASQCSDVKLLSGGLMASILTCS